MLTLGMMIGKFKNCAFFILQSKNIKMIYTHLVEVLKKFEVTEIECLNKPFDHNFEQALMTTKVDGVESGMVVEVLQKGYMLKDKMIRPALVKVSE